MLAVAAPAAPRDAAALAFGRPLCRWFIADDKGLVCKREEIDYVTGCCTTGQRHSCETCSQEDRCCTGYEQCVSCCLKPDHTPQSFMHRTFRGMNK